MKSVNAAVTTALEQHHNVYARPRLTVEWNLNRYGNPTVDNIPAEDSDGYDPELFPIESLIEPNRPTRGINKARIGEARVVDAYEEGVESRYYVASPDDIYKYWCSPVPTSGSTFPDHSDGRSVARPHVLYPSAVAANKIVIKIETSWASPTNFRVHVKGSSGSAWNYGSPAASNPDIDSDGVVTLYHSGGGVWTETPMNGPMTMVGGVMLEVDSMSRSNCFLNVIEISARRQEDLTPFLIEVDDVFDLAEPSNIYPLGTISSNIATVTLSNVDGRFNTANSGSEYYGIIEPNVEFNLEYVYTVNGNDYAVQQFRMFADNWSGQSDETVSVSLMDFSKYMQEIKPQPVMYRGASVSEILWRLCDHIGFNNYLVSTDVAEAQPRVNVFWTTGEETIWEVFDQLSRATQTAVYFDGWGRLRVMPRTVAFRGPETPVWGLRSDSLGSRLPDIVSAAQGDELGSNFVTVNYQTTEWPDFNKGFPKMDRVWEPEGTVTLRSAVLTRTLETSSSHFWIPADEATVWPYTGMVQVQGELIKYKAKQYAYREGGQQKYANLTSAEEKEKYDKKTTANIRYQNYFTGAIQIEERGVWNSQNKRHPVDAEGYTVRSIIGGQRSTGVAGFSNVRQESQAKMVAGPKFSGINDFLIATRGLASDQGYYYLGTRVMFNPGTGSSQRAGIVFNNNGTSEDGYYVELQSTNKVNRAQRNELIFWSRKGGSHFRIGGEGNAGAPLFIREGAWYDLDVKFSNIGGDHVITVFVNGVHRLTATVTGAQRNDFGGRFGMHTRGNTNVRYEYLYAVTRVDDQLASDVSTIWDRINGGYSGNQWDREWVWKWHKLTRRQKKSTGRERIRWAGMFMDEFGPYVHEVREYDIKFDPSPVMHSKLYFSNEAQVVCPEYHASAFGAKFILANAHRRNAVVHGEDTLTNAGSGGSINQVLFAYGRAVIVSESEKVEVKNDAHIRARGRIESDITSDWIQSKNAAEKLANWISNHWGTGLDTLEVTCFGNPLIELTDIVSVDYPLLGINSATHRYVVTGASTNFSGGIETTFTLRRAL